MKPIGHLWWSTTTDSVYGLVSKSRQAISWANVDPDLCRHIAFLSHNKLEVVFEDTTPNEYRKAYYDLYNYGNGS